MTTNPALVLKAERLRFPGMLPAEILVWLSWLAAHESEYTNWQYNFRIGAGIDPGPQVEEYWRNLAIKSTQLRLDAVGYQGDTPTIFEVKRRATPSNIGQLAVYFYAWVHDFPNAPRPKLVLVFNTQQAEITHAALAVGIQLVQVEADFSRLRAATAVRRAGVNPLNG